MHHKIVYGFALPIMNIHCIIIRSDLYCMMFLICRNVYWCQVCGAINYRKHRHCAEIRHSHYNPVPLNDSFTIFASK